MTALPDCRRCHDRIGGAGMSERDELARDIFTADNFRMSTEQAHAEWAEWIKGGTDPKQNYCYEIADGLLAAGWSRPRVVSSMDEVASLPVGGGAA